MPSKLGSEVPVRVRCQVPLLGTLETVVSDRFEEVGVDEPGQCSAKRTVPLLQRFPVRGLVECLSMDRAGLGSLALGDRLHEHEELGVWQSSCGIIGGTGVLRERQRDPKLPVG